MRVPGRIIALRRRTCSGDPRPPPLTQILALRESRHPSSPSDRKATPVTPATRRVRAPLKSCWKGPLPPRRITPTVTFTDYIVPALSTSSPPRNPDPGSARDPVSTRVQTPPAPVGPEPTRAGPQRESPLGSTEQTVGLRHGHPRRRLVNLRLFNSPPLSYRDALMDGAHGRFRVAMALGAAHRRAVGGPAMQQVQVMEPLIVLRPPSPAKGGRPLLALLLVVGGGSSSCVN